MQQDREGVYEWKEDNERWMDWEVANQYLLY